jgi:hypothetical protein
MATFGAEGPFTASDFHDRDAAKPIGLARSDRWEDGAMNGLFCADKLPLEVETSKHLKFNLPLIFILRESYIHGLY